MDYFGDGSGNSPVTGQPFGVHIEYYFEREPLGNAGALFKIKDKLTEDFLLLNADAMFDVDFNRLLSITSNMVDWLHFLLILIAIRMIAG